ncbi:hypothetical protein H2136_18360 [Aeromonas hydrophila]|uniref:Uncharacterized protein n=1 Tax=Aeromonas hydrophila TaxID=644 RepID=A0A926IY95_AERHY|nr:hypothetical protein [Aeromonas hydrophila]
MRHDQVEQVTWMVPKDTSDNIIESSREITLLKNAVSLLPSTADQKKAPEYGAFF